MMLFLNQKLGKNISIFISILLLFIGLIQLQKKQISKLSGVENKLDYFAEEEKLKSAIKFQQKMPAFGFDNLSADWNYLQFLQYFGDAEARDVTGYSAVTDYFETVVSRDPNFIQSHLSMSSSNSLFAAEPEKTIELLNKALKTVTPEIPNYPFFLWTYKATDEILFLGNLKAAKKSYEMAAKWANIRNDELGDNLASRYQESAKFLAGNPDSLDAQIGAWMNVLNQAPDVKTQQHAIDELKTLGVDVSIDDEGKINIVRQKRV